MKFNPWKTLGKVAKTFGLLGVAGLIAVASPEAVAVVAAPLGPWAPLVVLGANAGLAALADWYKHRTKDDPKGSVSRAR